MTFVYGLLDWVVSGAEISPMTKPIQQQIAVVAGLRRAFEKFRHHAAFTRRVKPAIEAELPGYTRCFSKELSARS